MPLLDEKDHRGLLNRYPRRQLLQTLQSKRSQGFGIRPMVIRQGPLLTTREFLILTGVAVFVLGLGFVAFGDLPRQGFGAFLAVCGLLLVLSRSLKDGKKQVQEAWKTFAGK